MADPYEVLGVAPDTSRDEAEQAYHHRLLRCHPDLHASEGPEAVARAEAQTVALNDAINRIRRGYRRPSYSRIRAEAWVGGPSRERTDPWPGTADRTQDHPPVPCPFCGVMVTSLGDFELHLTQRHRSMAGGPRRSAARSARRARRARWWRPMPLWLIAVINLALVLLAIAVVGAMGGHFEVMRRVFGADVIGPDCAPGTIVSTRWGPSTCKPDQWIQVYFFLGMSVTPLVGLWRFTTRTR